MVLLIAVFGISSLGASDPVSRKEFSELQAEVKKLRQQVNRLKRQQAALVGMLQSMDSRVGAVERQFPEGRTTKAATKRMRRGLQYMSGWLNRNNFKVQNFQFMPEQGNRGTFQLKLQIPDLRGEENAANKIQNMTSALLKILGPRSNPFGLTLLVRTPRKNNNPLNWGVGRFNAKNSRAVFMKGDAFKLLEKDTKTKSQETSQQK